MTLLANLLTVVQVDARLQIDLNAAAVRSSKATCRSERTSLPARPASPRGSGASLRLLPA